MRRDAFSEETIPTAKAVLRLDLKRVEGKEIELNVVAVAAGMPELSICKNILREGDTLTINNITINLSIEINREEL